MSRQEKDNKQNRFFHCACALLLLLLWFAEAATGGYFECWWFVLVLAVLLVGVHVDYYYYYFFFLFLYSFATAAGLAAVNCYCYRDTRMRATHVRPTALAFTSNIIHTYTHMHANKQISIDMNISPWLFVKILTQNIHTHTHTYIYTYKWILKRRSTGCDSTRLVLSRCCYCCSFSVNDAARWRWWLPISLCAQCDFLLCLLLQLFALHFICFWTVLMVKRLLLSMLLLFALSNENNHLFHC